MNLNLILILILARKKTTTTTTRIALTSLTTTVPKIASSIKPPGQYSARHVHHHDHPTPPKRTRWTKCSVRWKPFLTSPPTALLLLPTTEYTPRSRPAPQVMQEIIMAKITTKKVSHHRPPLHDP